MWTRNANFSISTTWIAFIDQEVVDVLEVFRVDNHFKLHQVCFSIELRKLKQIAVVVCSFGRYFNLMSIKILRIWWLAKIIMIQFKITLFILNVSEYMSLGKSDCSSTVSFLKFRSIKTLLNRFTPWYCQSLSPVRGSALFHANMTKFVPTLNHFLFSILEDSVSVQWVFDLTVMFRSNWVSHDTSLRLNFNIVYPSDSAPSSRLQSWLLSTTGVAKPAAWQSFNSINYLFGT